MLFRHMFFRVDARVGDDLGFSQIHVGGPITIVSAVTVEYLCHEYSRIFVMLFVTANSKRSFLPTTTTLPSFDVKISVSASVYKEMLALANIRPDEPDVKEQLDRFFRMIEPTTRTKEREFLALNSPARQLVTQALSDLVETGALRRRTEHTINQLLAEAPFSGSLHLDGSDAHSRTKVRAPTIQHTCAYGVASLIVAGQQDNVRRCKLSECRQFFWAPIRHGRRPSFCSEPHRLVGAKRISRGGNP